MSHKTNANCLETNSAESLEYQCKLKMPEPFVLIAGMVNERSFIILEGLQISNTGQFEL